MPERKPVLRLVCGDCLEVMKRLPDRHASLAVTSPPYSDCRDYGLGFKLTGKAWVDWMVPRVVEACRVTAGLVVVNMAGPVRSHSYSPVVEWLVADLTRNRGVVCGPSPYVFHRFGIPGSGGKQYHRRDWEPVYAFCLPDRLPLAWSDNVAMGHPPKWKPGGRMTNRTASGKREGKEEGQRVRKPLPAVANPGNVIRLNVGGNVTGHPLSHENEAPMHLGLAEFFVKSYCPSGGLVLDPFAGSGTTGQAALESGRRFLGIDVRESQVELCRRRLTGGDPSQRTTS